MRLLIHGAKEIVRVGLQGQLYKTGTDMNELNILTADSASTGLSIVIDKNGEVSAIGSDEQIKQQFFNSKFGRVIDASGCIIIPGLVDGHTHPVWAGDRVHEFSLKMAGASYMEIQQAGGGIHYTVNKTKEASEEELQDLLEERLVKMYRSGTTLVEVKSGYGLCSSEEMRQLKVIHKVSSKIPIDVSATFLGAHAVPQGLEPEEATRLIIEDHLPKILKARDDGELSVDSVDIFCEKGVFSVDQTSRIIAAARKQGGLMVNVHVDELVPLDGCKMAGELKAEAASHCEEISEEGIKSLSDGGTVAVLLPTTQLLLRLPAPPARKMIEQGVIVALGSDFNPNAYCLSMPTVLHLACVLLRLSPAEALSASTLNAAHSIRQSRKHGAIQPGMYGNLVVMEVPRWEHLVYQLSEHHNVIRHVISKGNVIHTRK